MYRALKNLKVEASGPSHDLRYVQILKIKIIRLVIESDSDISIRYNTNAINIIGVACSGKSHSVMLMFGHLLVGASNLDSFPQAN